MIDSEVRIDKKLNINTRGVIDWPLGVNLEYFRTESTLYSDLEHFTKEYDLLGDANLVDFGSGKGRVVFYFNYQLQMKTTGLEINNKSYQELVNNLKTYREKYPQKGKDISLYKEKAENYQIKDEENIFYFFNPFTVKIFKVIMKNIKRSLKENPRVVDIVIYYPSLNYTHYLDKQEGFHFIQLIKTPKYDINSRECFKVFRYHPKENKIEG